MAYTCVHGAELMYKYCDEHDLPAERCGKLIVATNESEHPQVEKLYKQGTANGVQGLEIVTGEQASAQESWQSSVWQKRSLVFTYTNLRQVREMEPNIHAYSALHSPNTGITNYWLVAQRMAQEIRESG